MIFLRTDDIPVLCAEGAIDMGITGSDLVLENQVEITTRMELGVGKCRLAVCVPENSQWQSPRDLDGCRVATSFPRTTEVYLAEHGAADIVTAFDVREEKQVPRPPQRDYVVEFVGE